MSEIKSGDWIVWTSNNYSAYRRLRISRTDAVRAKTIKLFSEDGSRCGRQRSLNLGEVIFFSPSKDVAEKVFEALVKISDSHNRLMRGAQKNFDERRSSIIENTSLEQAKAIEQFQG